MAESPDLVHPLLVRGIHCATLCVLCVMLPAGSLTTPNSTASACFASNSSVAAWSSSGNKRSLLSFSSNASVLLVPDMVTGFDVPCGPTQTASRCVSTCVHVCARVCVWGGGGSFILCVRLTSCCLRAHAECLLCVCVCLVSEVGGRA
jgi:hypothetical protein